MSYLSIWAQERQGLSPWPAARRGKLSPLGRRVGREAGGPWGGVEGVEGTVQQHPALRSRCWSGVLGAARPAGTGSILGRVLDSKLTTARACCAKMDTVLLEQEGAYLKALEGF